MFKVDIRPAGNFVPYYKVKDIGAKAFNSREEAIEYTMWRLRHIDPSIEIDIDWGDQITLSKDFALGNFSGVGFYVEQVSTT